MTSQHNERTLVPMKDSGGDLAVNVYPGNGPKVLLIHGISSSSADFNPVINQMQAFCQPITMDLRGHGNSSQPQAGYHYSDYIRDLETVIAQLSLEQPIVLGHSLGGIVTLMWAAQHPNDATALIIEDSPLRSGSDFIEAFNGWLTLNALSQEQARDWYETKNPSWNERLLDQRSHDMVNTSRTAILELQQASLSNEGLDSVAALDSISSPMLFLQGDPTTGSMVHPDDMADLQRKIPHMGVKLFPEAGHTIHRSHPQEWLASVQAFIEGLDV